MRGRASLVLALALTQCRRATTPVVHAIAPEDAAGTVPTSDAEELHAFAKLYGYVRFFHPSDEAAAADWDLVAVEGVRSVTRGSTQAELVASLREIFGPLAPTLQLHRTHDPVPSPETSKTRAAIAWQHLGFGFGELVSVYASGRTNRPRHTFSEGSGWATISRSIDAAQVRGKRVRLRGWAKVDGRVRGMQAQLWLRVDGAAKATEFMDNMAQRPIVATTWQAATLEAPVIGARASKIAFGGLAIGSGAAYFDDFVLEAAPVDADTWTKVALENAGFDADMPTQGWKHETLGYEFSAAADAHGGRAALKIARVTATYDADLFAERPGLGETFDADLGAGLGCRVVLGLPSHPYEERERPAQRPLPDATDPAVRIAAIVIGWNVLRHFYPYHDVIGEDWDAVLDAALADVQDDRDPRDLWLTLRRLVHRLHDGHGNVDGPLLPEGSVQVRLGYVEKSYVVLAAPENGPLRRGDEVVSVDGVAIETLHRQQAELVSGSPQWIDYLLLEWGRVTAGPNGSTASVEIRRDGKLQKFDLTRTLDVPPLEHERKSIEKLTGNIYYVDLDRVTDDELNAKLGALAMAPGVVFDMRGYPESEPAWISNLLTKPDDAKWMFVPNVIRPDYDVASFTAHGWELQPVQPHIGGKVVFITGPGAISYAESVLGYVEGYELGAIVGRPTAGANGNVNPFLLPGGFRITFTGMKVTRMDGRQHHLLGIQPTHPVTRTLAAIRAGRDEELEAALALVRQEP